MNRSEVSKKYWKYYLLLERKFLSTTPYVDIDKRNYNSFSVEYAYLLQSICGELDTFFKVFCGYNVSDRKNINDYADMLFNNYPEIVEERISIVDRDIEIKPFAGWDKAMPAESLKWWCAYNSIKHNRYDNIDKANLENVINSLAALFLLESKMLKDVASNAEFDMPDIVSELFEIKGWDYKYYPLKNMFTLADDIR